MKNQSAIANANPLAVSAMGEHAGFRQMFASQKLTLGFILPLEAYPNTPAPTMKEHAAIGKLADELGFAGVWARDVPLYDPAFGDTGQLYEPFTYLGFLAASTEQIALATGSAVITLRHPLLLAKQAVSIDHMSDGRMVLGISSGDRPTEYPAFGLEAEYETRGERFRDAYEVFRAATEGVFPDHQSARFGTLSGNLTLLPAPVHGRIPAIVTGRSRQDLDWIARNSDGWLYYFIPPDQLAPLTSMWKKTVARECGEEIFKPFAQGMFFDLDADPNYPLQRIHSGLRAGRNAFVDYLTLLQQLGVNHVAMNMKTSRRPAKEVLLELAEHVLPLFPSNLSLPNSKND